MSTASGKRLAVRPTYWKPYVETLPTAMPAFRHKEAPPVAGRKVKSLVGIVTREKRQGFHDRVAGTEVLYGTPTIRLFQGLADLDSESS